MFRDADDPHHIGNGPGDGIAVGVFDGGRVATKEFKFVPARIDIKLSVFSALSALTGPVTLYTRTPRIIAVKTATTPAHSLINAGAID